MIDFFYKKRGLVNIFTPTEQFSGGVFASGDSWMEIWQSSGMMSEASELNRCHDSLTKLIEKGTAAKTAECLFCLYILFTFTESIPQFPKSLG